MKQNRDKCIICNSFVDLTFNRYLGLRYGACQQDNCDAYIIQDFDIKKINHTGYTADFIMVRNKFRFSDKELLRSYPQ